MRPADCDFRDFVEQHQAMVYSIALRIAGDREAAEEIAQDVFLKLHSAIRKLESPDHVAFWLRRVTVNHATDHLRRRKRRPEFGAEEWRADLREAHGAREGVTGALEVRIERALGALPESLRVAVVLRYQEDLAPDEIAQALGQPVATVKCNLRRALELLRRKAATTLKEFVRE